MDDDAYFDFCVANPEIRFERTSTGEIVIVPPAGYESEDQNAEVVMQLRLWAKRDGRGKATGPTAEFILPTRAALSPDAAWVSYGRLAQFSKQQRRKFLHVCPGFVIEVMSPTDRLAAAKKKMEERLRGGIDLGWLIDGDRRAVYVYRKGQQGTETVTGTSTISGEGPVAGLELNLDEVWAGL